MGYRGHIPKDVPQLFKDGIVMAKEAVSVATLFLQRTDKTAKRLAD
jgi:hypothetical protein